MSTYAEILQKKAKDWNCPDMMNAAKTDMTDKIPFSSPMMNWCTYGGVPRRRFTEFFGKPGAGKSTSAVDICKNAIQVFDKEYDEKLLELRASSSKMAAAEIADLEETGPKKILYVDLEHGFDRKWSETVGIDMDRIDIMQPGDIPAEDILQALEELIQTGEVGLLVLDSIPSLVTKDELTKKLTEPTKIATVATVMTLVMRKWVALLTRYDCTVILINQLRENMKNPFDPSTPGGLAVKFYSSLRIMFELGSPLDFLGNTLPMSTEDPAGYIVNARIKKQKTAPNDRRNGTYYLMCQSGIRPDFDFAQLALNKYGLIKKKAAWFSFVDPLTGEMLEEDDPLHEGNTKVISVNGMAKVYDFLQSNQEYYQKLQKFILDDINGVKDDADTESGSDEVL